MDGIIKGIELITEIITATLSAASAIVVAIVSKRLTNSQKEEEKRAARRQKESLLSLQMINAAMELSVVSANALTGGHNNGNVALAKQKAEQAAEAYALFEHQILAEELAQ